MNNTQRTTNNNNNNTTTNNNNKMGGTKRMSKDEKCNTILGIYHKTKSVYTEKEIIALATKEGVTPQT